MKPTKDTRKRQGMQSLNRLHWERIIRTIKRSITLSRCFYFWLRNAKLLSSKLSSANIFSKAISLNLLESRRRCCNLRESLMLSYIKRSSLRQVFQSMYLTQCPEINKGTWYRVKKILRTKRWNQNRSFKKQLTKHCKGSISRTCLTRCKKDLVTIFILLRPTSTSSTFCSLNSARFLRQFKTTKTWLITMRTLRDFAIAAQNISWEGSITASWI